MASHSVALASLGLLLVSCASGQWIGGASSFANLGPALLSGPCSTSGVTYDSVGSTAGIDGFNSGKYLIALSDDPMSIVQQSQGIALSGKKLTLPVVISVYSFFISGIADGSAKLTASQSFSIYKNGGRWKAYGVKNPYPNVRAIGRSDGSGTTLLFKRYWNKALGIYKKYKIPDDGTPLTFKNMLFAAKSSGVCTLTANTPGGICYSQTGICNSIAPSKTGEVLLQNKGKRFVQPSASFFQGIIPRVLPAPTSGGWSAAGSDLILANGPQTPPIGSFEYSFIRSVGLLALPDGPMAKTLMTCILQNAGALAGKYYFFPVPSKLLKVNLAAVAKIK